MHPPHGTSAVQFGGKRSAIDAVCPCRVPGGSAEHDGHGCLECSGEVCALTIYGGATRFEGCEVQRRQNRTTHHGGNHDCGNHDCGNPPGSGPSDAGVLRQPEEGASRAVGGVTSHRAWEAWSLRVQFQWAVPCPKREMPPPARVGARQEEPVNSQQSAVTNPSECPWPMTGRQRPELGRHN